VKRLSDELKSSLTAAKLKALCILNDLPTSGNKSDLVDRLIESGLSKKELGIEELVDQITAKAPLSEELDDSQPSLSLEDDDTITPEVEPAKESTAPPVVVTVSDDDILDAEVLDAEFITLDEEVKAPKTQEESTFELEKNAESSISFTNLEEKKKTGFFSMLSNLMSSDNKNNESSSPNKTEKKMKAKKEKTDPNLFLFNDVVDESSPTNDNNSAEMSELSEISSEKELIEDIDTPSYLRKGSGQ